MPLQKKQNLIFAVMTSFLMAGFFSGFFTFLAFGFTAEWLSRWGKGFLMGWPLGMLISHFTSRYIRAFAVKMTAKNTIVD